MRIYYFITFDSDSEYHYWQTILNMYILLHGKICTVSSTL